MFSVLSLCFLDKLSAHRPPRHFLPDNDALRTRSVRLDRVIPIRDGLIREWCSLRPAQGTGTMPETCGQEHQCTIRHSLALLSIPKLRETAPPFPTGILAYANAPWATPCITYLPPLQPPYTLVVLIPPVHESPVPGALPDDEPVPVDLPLGVHGRRGPRRPLVARRVPRLDRVLPGPPDAGRQVPPVLVRRAEPVSFVGDVSIISCSLNLSPLSLCGEKGCV